ncbi:hypothetical protein [Marivita sp.]|uniref:hypothetical protein n=1 Tax=Marivita sp. TaxID=2003365 RepID=UPI003F71CA00
MTDTSQTNPTNVDLDDTVKATVAEERANMLTLEIVFLVAVGLVVLVAFFEALTYQLVSARTPFVIMVPLFILIAVHAVRLYRRREQAEVGERLGMAISGRLPGLNKVMMITVSLVVMLVVIIGLGHYIGLGTFCFLLMWRLGGVAFGRAALVALGTLLAIYLIFELAFDLELYRGLLFRWMAGYRDF